MEIVQKAISIKLNKEERDNLINAITLIEEMRNRVDCDECPFKERCDTLSKSECLLYTLQRDLRYVNNKCD